MKNKNKGLLLVLSTAFISGFAIFISKFGVSIINPYIFTGLKNVIVALLAVSWLLMLRDWQILKKLGGRTWLLLLFVGLIGGSIPFLLFFKGLSMTTAAQGAFIHKTMFVYVALLAGIFLKEKINKKYLIGGLFLLLGNMLLLKAVPHQIGWGDFLVFLAAFFWAGENVLSKYLLKNLPPRIVIWSRMFFGSLFIVFFWAATGQAGLVMSLNLEQIGWLLISSVILFGYVSTWYSGLKYVPVSLAATVLLLGSPITTLLSLIFLGGSVVFGQILGIILITLAVFLIFKSANYLSQKTYAQEESI